MKKIPLIIVLASILSAIIVPFTALAADNSRLIAAGVTLQQELQPSYAVNIKVPEKSNRAALGIIILQIIAGSLIYAAGPIAVLMIAVGGFRYVISHGAQEEMEKAKKTIMMAVVGLLIIIVSFTIVSNVISISQKTASEASPPAAQQPQAPPEGGAGKGSTINK